MGVSETYLVGGAVVGSIMLTKYFIFLLADVMGKVERKGEGGADGEELCDKHSISNASSNKL